MKEKRPNILILLLDAARAENFSILGYGKPTTPHMERHASCMAQYTNCVSTAPWTLPSTASLFTGVYPSRHKLVLDGEKLDATFVTLAELLKDDGYFTASISGGFPYLTDFSGLDRGFTHKDIPERRSWRDWMQGLRQKKIPEEHTALPADLDTGSDLKSETESQYRGDWKQRFKFWLSGYSDSGAKAFLNHVRSLWQENAGVPKFIYVHLQETHADYRPPHRFRKRFLAPHLRSRNFAAINQRPNPHAVGLIKMTEEEYEVLTGLYDGCIAYLDEQIGRLLDDLSGEPDFEDTIVIVTSDHGDCIGRHGVLSHQFVCYEELVHIPFLVKWPASAGVTGMQEKLVQNVDLLPTLCGLVGLEVPDFCEGINILEEERDFAYSELLKPFGICAVKKGMHEMAPHYNRAVLAARSEKLKLITYSNDQPDESLRSAVCSGPPHMSEEVGEDVSDQEESP